MDYAPTFLEMAGIPFARTESKTCNGSENHNGDVRINGHPEATNGDGHRKTVSKATKTALHRGRPVYPHRGRSWVPYFSKGESAEDDEAFAIYPSDDAVGWELFARAALRKGDWKIVHIPQEVGGKGVGDEGWELFNLRQDPGETTDVSGQEREKFRELLGHWEDYVVEYGIVWGEKAMCAGVDEEHEPYWHENDNRLQEAWIKTEVGHAPSFKVQTAC